MTSTTYREGLTSMAPTSKWYHRPILDLIFAKRAERKAADRAAWDAMNHRPTYNSYWDYDRNQWVVPAIDCDEPI